MNVFELFASLKLDDKEFEKGLTDSEKKAHEVGKSIGSALKSGAELVGKTVKGVGIAVGGAAAAITPLVKSAVDAYGETQQLVGGVETLFGTGGKSLEEYAKSVGKSVDEVRAEYNHMQQVQDEVLNNANNAFATTGQTANEYMEQVTSFAASLIQSTGRGTQTDLEELEANLKEKLTTQKRAYQDEYDAAKSALSDQVKLQQAAYKDEYDALKASWDERIKLAKSGGSADADALKAQKDEEIRLLKAAWDEQIRVAKENGDENTDLLKAQKDEEVRLLKESWDATIKAAKEGTTANAEELKAQRDAELKALKESQNANIQAMKDGNAESLKEMKRANEDKLTQLKADNKKLLEETEAANNASEKTPDSMMRAAKLADQAMIDMSDNANKMGTSMESIKNAYQGFAKQNYTMLDNLKLGYGGTKEEMERLLADAEAISGVHYDVSSYADIVEAIHLIQEQMGISGTTAEEAGKTITGSLGQVKAAWGNLVAGLANPNADVGSLIDNVVRTGKTALENLKPTILQAIRGVTTLIKEATPIIVEEIPTLVNELLPPFLEVTFTLFAEIAKTIPKYFPLILEKVRELIPLIGKAISDTFPKLAFIGDHLEGIIMTIVGVFTGAKVIGGIAKFVSAISTIVPLITTTLIPALAGIAPIILPIIAGIAALVAVGVLLYKNWDTIKEKAETIWNNLKTFFSITKDVIVGKFNEIKENVSQAFDAIKDKIENSAIVQTVKNVWGAAKDTVSESLNNIKQAYDEHGGGLQGAVAATLEGIKEYYKAGFNFIDNLTDGKLSNMLKTVSDKFTQIKDSISSRVQDIKDNISEKWNNIKENTTTMFSGLNQITSNKLDGLRNSFNDFSRRAKEIFFNMWENITDIFDFSQAFTWGRDMLTNFVDGIREGWDNLKGTLQETGQAIKDRIGFSEPKKGVLSDFHTYAPDMMDLFIQGIKDNTAKLQDQLDKSFSFKPSLDAEINPSATGGMSTGGGTVVNMPINIYGAQGQDIRELADLIEQRINHNYNVLSNAYGVG